MQREDRFCTGCGVNLHEDTVAPAEPATTEAAATEPTEPATTEPTDPAEAATTDTAEPATTDTAEPAAPEPTEPDPTEPAAPEPAEPATTGPDPVVIADEPTELVPSVRRSAPTSSSGAPPVSDTQPAASIPAVTDPGATPGGTALDDRAESTDTIAGDEWSADDPVWAPTGAVPAQPVATGGDTDVDAVPAQPVATGGDTDVDAVPAEPPLREAGTDATTPAGFTADMPVTEPVTEVWTERVEATPESDTATPFDFVEHEITAEVAPPATAEMPAVVMPAQPAHRFRLSAVTVIAVATGLVTLASLFATMITVTSDQRLEPSEQTPFGFRTGTWIADDLADNLSIAGLAAIILVVAGGVASGFHWRWGAGLAGGAGLAVAGLAALTIGLAQIPIDAAHEFVLIPTEQQFTLTITRDVGYWLTVAAAALGVVLFFAAINDASGDRRGGLNPWIAALGALSAVVAAAGPLIPENQAVFSDNWYLVEGPGEAPAMLLVGRLVQLSLFVLAGVVGFLTVRRWGLGLAIGASVPIIWLATSTLFELTDKPVGPGFRNPGATDMHIHGVTIIGVSAVAAMAVLAVIAAYDQAVRERR